MIAFLTLTLSISSISCHPKIKSHHPTETACQTLKWLEQSLKSAVAREDVPVCPDSQPRTECSIATIEILKKFKDDIQVDDMCLQKVYENLSDKACFCGGLLKFFEMLTMVKALFCDEDQGRESRLFFANGFPWAPAPAPTPAPTPAPIKVLTPAPPQTKEPTPYKSSSPTQATTTVPTSAPTPNPTPPPAQTQATTEASTPTPTLAPGQATSPASAQASKSCNCGVPVKNRKRIVGGRPANKNEYPWQVALLFNGGRSPFCGGTIISDDTILTAAHCEQEVSTFKVVVGEHDYTDPDDGQVSVTPSSWLSHPSYDPSTQDNDFALVKLATVLTFSSRVMPACLPDSATDYDAVTALVTGWGTISSGGGQPLVLHEADVTTRTNAECVIPETMYYTSEITDNMICAAGDGKDSCQGDSGGPLITLENNLYYSLIGVVSWGIGCARSDAPGVYSRVTSQLSWITTKMSGNTCAKPTS